MAKKDILKFASSYDFLRAMGARHLLEKVEETGSPEQIAKRVEIEKKRQMEIAKNQADRLREEKKIARLKKSERNTYQRQ